MRGRVQGVGFRYFAQHSGVKLGLRGYTRNLDDGRVEVYAVGDPKSIDIMAGLLRTGPRWSDVRGVEEMQAAIEHCDGFRIEP